MRFSNKRFRLLPSLFSCILATAPWVAQAQPQPASAHVNLYFAQIADGQFDGGRWQTVITLVNTNTKAAGALIEFYNSQGAELPVDFGGGMQSKHMVQIPPEGSVTLASQPSTVPVRSGWARVFADLPLMGSASYRLWLGGRAVQEVTAPPTLPTASYASYANRELGVAVANPRNRSLQVTASLLTADGAVLGPSLIALPPYGHTAFNVRERFPAADFRDSMLRLECVSCPDDLFLAWTMNADSSGTFSSLPPGNVTPPISHWDRIWNVYQRVLHTARETGYFSGPSPRLVIRYEKQVNAYAKNGNEVGVYMGLSELLGDSDSELAYVIGHELGHIIQQRSGDFRLWHPSNAELDADIWGALFSMLSGYDAYASAGALSKLAMATGRAGLMTQFFEDIIPVADAHRSFNTRMEAVYEFLVFLCSTDIGRAACQDYKNILHPHLPDSAPLRIEDLERRGYRSPAEIRMKAEDLRARLAATEATSAGEPDGGRRY